MQTSSQCHDVVFTFGLETFDDVHRREFCRPADQAVLALASDDRVGQLLVADPWRSYPVSAARRRSFRLVEQTSVDGRSVVRVRPHRVRRADPTHPSAVARTYRSYGRSLGKALERARRDSHDRRRSAALVTCHPFVAAYCDADWIDNLVYFGRDDWATGESVRPWWPAYVDAYRRIDERADAIFVVSEELATRVSPRAQIVPNGVNPMVWRPRHPIPSRIGALPRPRAVYTGTIDGRLEPRLVELTAEAVGSLIMIGHHGDPSVIRWLSSIRNVHLFESVGQEELAATVQACDVGIIPHRNQADIRAMSPLKLYEFLAAGLPVVAVDLPPIRGVDDDRVNLCLPEQWPHALSGTLRMERASEAARLRFIDEAAWSRRMEPLVDAAVRPRPAADP